MTKQAYFKTLNDSLDAEGVVSEWTLGVNINYGETVQCISSNNILVSVYRDLRGMYERAIHYSIGRK